MIVGVWVPAPFGALLFFVCCLVLSVRGKIRIFDRGMCTSSLRLVLSFVFATYFMYSCTGISMRLCLILVLYYIDYLDRAFERPHSRKKNEFSLLKPCCGMSLHDRSN